MKKSKHIIPQLKIVFLLLLSISICIFSLPNVQGASIIGNVTIDKMNAGSIPDANRRNIDEKSIPLLSNVLSLDLTRYSATQTECSSDLYRNLVPQENVRYILKSNESKLDLRCTFTNGHLRLLSVLESSGTPSLSKLVTKPEVHEGKTLQVMDKLATANNFLNDYAAYSGKAFYRELASMLNVVEAEKNLTFTSEDTKLEAVVTTGFTTYRWTYSVNGFEAPDKCVALSYNNGFLNYFSDTWEIFSLGSTNVNVTAQEAIDSAIKSTKLASWSIGSGDCAVIVKNFTVANAMLWETVFRSSLVADEARNSDTLMLYPMYHIWVSLDKLYPGNVYGFNVYVWADTGEIAAIKERVYTLDAPINSLATDKDYTIEPVNATAFTYTTQSTVLVNSSVVVPALIIAIIGVIPAFVLLIKRRNGPKRLKIFGLLLCTVIFSTLFFFPILSANAYEPVKRATIWGAESIGEYGRKTAYEVTLQEQIAENIAHLFNDDGYYASDLQGELGSDKSEILDQIYTNEHDYSRAAVVDFDHGVGRSDYQGLNEFHYMFEDNTGRVSGVGGDGSDPNNWVNTHMVYDMDVFYQTHEEKTFFAFINTCLSACINDTIYDTNGYPSITGMPAGGGEYISTDNPIGMPYAWTHRVVREKGYGFNTAYHMSEHGYSDPDTGNYVYLGFPWGSASLGQTISGSSAEYYYWVEAFFSAALSTDVSVKQALNIASQNMFSGYNFNEIDLYTGFDALWPMWEPGSGWNNTQYSDSTLAVYGNGNIHLYQYLVYECVSASAGGFGGVEETYNIVGANDGYYTYLYAFTVPPIYGQAVIDCRLTCPTSTSGHIYLYGYTSSLPTYLQVWVSDDDVNWYCLYYYPSMYVESPQWIDVGSYSNFRYVAVCVYGQGEMFVDSILVIPPLEH